MKTPDEPVAVRKMFLKAAGELPYTGNIDPLPCSVPDGVSEAEFLTMLIGWFEGFKRVLSAAEQGSREMARELTELRDQRDAIRSFLGTDLTDLSGVYGSARFSSNDETPDNVMELPLGGPMQW